MPFNLQKAPQGLLELFRLRTHGSAPPLFGEQVQPTVDVAEFYAADRKQVLTSGGTVSFFPFSDSYMFATPVRLHAVGFAFTTGAAPPPDLFVSMSVITDFGLESAIASWQVVPNAATLVAGNIVRFGLPIPGWVLRPQTVLRARAFASAPAPGADHGLSVTAFVDDLG